MQSIKDEEFEILGLKLKYSPETSGDESTGLVSSSEVVEYMQSEIIELQKKSGRALDHTQMAILIALKAISEKLELEKSFASKLSQLEKTAKDAFEYLDGVSMANKS